MSDYGTLWVIVITKTCKLDVKMCHHMHIAKMLEWTMKLANPPQGLQTMGHTDMSKLTFKPLGCRLYKSQIFSVGVHGFWAKGAQRIVQGCPKCSFNKNAGCQRIVEVSIPHYLPINPNNHVYKIQLPIPKDIFATCHHIYFIFNI